MNLQHELSQYPNKEKVFEIASYIGSHTDRFAELINLVLKGDKSASLYASWVVNPCLEQHPELLQPHIQTLIENLSRPNLHDSIKRSTVKALANVGGDISENLQGYALQHCFDFLLDTKAAVSIQVYAMQTVFNISKNEPDLLQELSEVIKERLPYGSAGYKARGSRILKEINKILASEQ